MAYPDSIEMLEWTLNGSFDAGADQIRKRDIRILIDPNSTEFADAVRRWETSGVVRVIMDVRVAAEKEPFLMMLRRFDLSE